MKLPIKTWWQTRSQMQKQSFSQGLKNLSLTRWLQLLFNYSFFCTSEEKGCGRQKSEDCTVEGDWMVKEWTDKRLCKSFKTEKYSLKAFWKGENPEAFSLSQKYRSCSKGSIVLAHLTNRKWHHTLYLQQRRWKNCLGWLCSLQWWDQI